MNEASAGCYACNQKTYLPREFAGPLDETEAVWNSLGGLGQGLIIAGVVVAACYFLPKLLKSFR